MTHAPRAAATRVILAAVALVSGGCGEQSNESTTILRVANWGSPAVVTDFMKMERKFWGEFERQHPGVKVQVEQIPGGGQFAPKLLMMHLTGSVPDVIGNPRLVFREHAVADGDTVCAFGKYSVERAGLVPGPTTADPYPVRLRRGDAATVGRALAVSALGYSVGAVAMTGLAVGAIWLTRLMFTS